MFSETETERSWRERALDRSLEPARTRSVDRLERLLDAARELANETGGAAFTVAQVAERAGFSLKSFYRHFAGKDDLLIALIEEETPIGARLLSEAIEKYDKPVERMRSYIIGLFHMLTYPGALGYASVLVREHRRLSEARPDTLRAALAPLLRLLEEEIGSATAAGVCASPDPARDAETVFAVLLEGIYNVSLGRAEPREEAEYLWGFCWAGLSRTAERGEPSR
jgi:AcrR family transcriptional regulator